MLQAKVLTKASLIVAKDLDRTNIILTFYLTTLAPTTTKVDFHGERP